MSPGIFGQSQPRQIEQRVSMTGLTFPQRSLCLVLTPTHSHYSSLSYTGLTCHIKAKYMTYVIHDVCKFISCPSWLPLFTVLKVNKTIQLSTTNLIISREHVPSISACTFILKHLVFLLVSFVC